MPSIALHSEWWKGSDWTRPFPSNGEGGELPKGLHKLSNGYSNGVDPLRALPAFPRVGGEAGSCKFTGKGGHLCHT